ncbi:MAG: 23S rRNA (guanosine(2251)-2'-O)-methyltransferase RlmB [Firmicutes bacterium]|nr:23S rRNA (guanosine(2251)-2'-O)-methyltransferase RlmB [Bacillota bacterium]
MKREKYFAAKEAREKKAREAEKNAKAQNKSGRDGVKKTSRLEKEYAPREARSFRGYNDERSGEERREAFAAENPNMIIGRNPVMEAVKSGRTIEKILMQKDGEGSIKKIASLARERGLQIQYVDRVALDRVTGSRSHQGIAAYVSAYSYCEVSDILKAAKDRGEDPFVILLDGLEDPHNLGAIMRTADAVGAHGIVIPSRRAVGLTETVAKASAGAIEYIPVAKVANMTAAIDELKEAGLWIGACDMDGQEYYQAQLTGPIGLVVGGEGQGVSRLVREHCDFILSIPMVGKISSLNASNAAAILMYETFRQRAGK